MITKLLGLCIATFIGAKKGPTAYEHLQEARRNIPAGIYVLAEGGFVNIQYEPHEMHLTYNNQGFALRAPTSRDNRWVVGPQFHFLLSDVDGRVAASIYAADEHDIYISKTQMIFLIGERSEIQQLRIERVLTWDKKGLDSHSINGTVLRVIGSNNEMERLER